MKIDLMFGRSSLNDGKELLLPEYVNERERKLQRVNDFARNRVQIASDRIKEIFYQKATPINFKDRDAVWLFHPPRSRGTYRHDGKAGME